MGLLGSWAGNGDDGVAAGCIGGAAGECQGMRSQQGTGIPGLATTGQNYAMVSAKCGCCSAAYYNLKFADC